MLEYAFLQSKNTKKENPRSFGTKTEVLQYLATIVETAELTIDSKCSYFIRPGLNFVG